MSKSGSKPVTAKASLVSLDSALVAKTFTLLLPCLLLSIPTWYTALVKTPY